MPVPLSCLSIRLRTLLRVRHKQTTRPTVDTDVGRSMTYTRPVHASQAERHGWK